MWLKDCPEAITLDQLCQQFRITVDQAQVNHFVKLMRLQKSLTDQEIFYKILTDEQREIVDDYWAS